MSPGTDTSRRYVQNVNVTNTRVNVVQVTNVYNNVTVNHVTNITYVNQRVTNSVTVVNHDTFVNARPVHNNIVRVDAEADAGRRRWDARSSATSGPRRRACWVPGVRCR